MQSVPCHVINCQLHNLCIIVQLVIHKFVPFFSLQVRDKQNLAVNVVYAPPHQTLSEYKPRRALDQLKFVVVVVV